MAAFTDEQIRDLAKLMPRIVKVLRAATDAGDGYLKTEKGAFAEALPPEKAVATLKDLNIGALVDQIDDWCWHVPSCKRGEVCDNAVGR